MRRRFAAFGVVLALTIAVGVIAVLLLRRDAAPAPRPHIVFFLADDLGWGDVGYHGSEIQTPNIDRLAESGARLAQFYVLQACTPTRAALMTGRYPMRFGMQAGIVWGRSEYGLPAEERTLAAALRAAGYRTVMCGKWHLGHAKPEFRPTQRGFDHFYGTYVGELDYFTRRLDGRLWWRRNEESIVELGYTTDLIAAEAERIILEHDPAQPLFLYVPFTAPHRPLQAPAAYLERYQQIEEPRRTYAAMVTCLDDAVGRILAALQARGMRDETLVVFCSDNGAVSRAEASNAPLRGGKGGLYEGALRVPAVVSWPGVIGPGATVEAMLHAVDWYPTLVRLAGGSSDQALPLDGRDLWPTITRGAPSPHEELLLNAYESAAALRRGAFKLIVQDPGPAETVELYNVVEDAGERNDLALERADVARDLRERLRAYQAVARPVTALEAQQRGEAGLLKKKRRP